MDRSPVALGSLYFYISPLVVLGFLIAISFIRNFHQDRWKAFNMALLFFSICYLYAIDFLTLSGYSTSFPYLVLTNIPFGLLVNPLIYLVLVYAIGRKVGVVAYSLHLIPATIAFINFLPFLLMPSQAKLALMEQLGIAGVFIGNVETLWIPGQWLIPLRLLMLCFYFFLLLRLIYKNRTLLSLFSPTKELVYAFTAYLGVKILIVLYLLFFTSGQGVPVLIMVAKLRILLSLALMIYFFLRPEILFSNYWSRKLVNDPYLPEEKTQDSDSYTPNQTQNKQLIDIQPDSLEKFDELSVQEKKRWILVQEYLRDKKPHLQQDFSIKKIEAELNISSKLVSKIIKFLYDANFNQYINQLRIEYALMQLDLNPVWRSYTIEALAYNVGFNSPNSFYGYFKGHTGKTPREYIMDLELCDRLN
jgi:AraC-like DNA-binding protein